VCANTSLYGFLENFPITAYGEYIVVTIQGILIVLFVWIFSKPRVPWIEQSLFGVFIVVYPMSVYIFLPKDFYYLLVVSNWPLFMCSRGLQIIENYRIQHTSAQSILTDGSVVIGSLVRIVTTLQEVGWDQSVLLSFGLYCFMSMILVLQNIYYRKNTEKFFKSRQVGLREGANVETIGNDISKDALIVKLM
jgi:hypothetical protein